jgi:hypothetical protein
MPEQCEVETTVDTFPLGLKLATDGGKCKVVKSERQGIQVGDEIFSLNEQPIPRGLRAEEVEAVLQLAKLPFQLVIKRKEQRRDHLQVGRRVSSRSKVGLHGTPCFQSINAVIGHCSFSPLGFMFQTYADGSHRIIFIDQSSDAIAKFQVGDCIVGINYKPLGFGVNHDDAADMIRKTKRPFTLNLTRKRESDGDELGSLVRRVKAGQAYKHAIGMKDKEINSLREQLAIQAQCDVHSAAEEAEEVGAKAEAEVRRLRSELASLQAFCEALNTKKAADPVHDLACTSKTNKHEDGCNSSAKVGWQKQNPASSHAQGVVEKRAQRSGVLGMLLRGRGSCGV